MKRTLTERIARRGPLTVAEFMDAALGDPQSGYYRTRAPIGAEGDFVTAPEISQMFGELIGIWCLDLFEQMGEPARLDLVELGPGRGSLMADLWRAAAIRPVFRAAARVHLVETSPVLRRRQAAALRGIDAEWHADFAEIRRAGGNAPLIVIANEFFDALPIHQLVKTGKGWRERTVAFDAETDSFVFSLSEEESDACTHVPAALRASAEGAIFEASAAGQALMRAIAASIESRSGSALIIDYGHVRSALGDTLQSVRAHRYHDVLSEPGRADITAHVDFEALAESARGSGARVFGPVPQVEFLRQLGIGSRAAALRAHASPAQARAIDSSLARLTGADQMGGLFKAIAAASAGLVPAGFAAAGGNVR